MAVAGPAADGPLAEVVVREPPVGTRLVPMNLESGEERSMLKAQRTLCGWNEDKVDFWRTSMAQCNQTLFWITIPADSPIALERTKVDGLGHLRRPVPPDLDQKVATLEQVFAVGHVSLNKVDTPNSPGLAPDTSLASGDGKIMTITTLFVLPSFASSRFGSFAMDQCETWARQLPFGSPQCEAVTINTMSPRYMLGGLDGLEGMGRWEAMGSQIPKDNSLWYTRRGYVKFDEAIRYFTPNPHGGQWSWFGIFMRKDFRQAAMQ